MYYVVPRYIKLYYPPPPSRPQNIENKEQGKTLPRKIFHPKELQAKYSIQRTYARNPGGFEPSRSWEQQAGPASLATGHRPLATGFQRSLGLADGHKRLSAAIGHSCPNTTVCERGPALDNRNPAGQITKVIRDLERELTKVTSAFSQRTRWRRPCLGHAL